MKEELTTKMHSEFSVSKSIDVRNKVGSAIQFAMIGSGGKEELEKALPLYGITLQDYERWKDYWSKMGVKI